MHENLKKNIMSCASFRACFIQYALVINEGVNLKFLGIMSYICKSTIKCLSKCGDIVKIK